MPSRFFAMQIRSFAASALTSIKHSLSQTAYSAIISTLRSPVLFSQAIKLTHSVNRDAQSKNYICNLCFCCISLGVSFYCDICLFIWTKFNCWLITDSCWHILKYPKLFLPSVIRVYYLVCTKLYPLILKQLKMLLS